MKRYIDPLLHWWWLIVLCTALASVSAFVALQRMPPEYEVRATLIVGQSFSRANPNSGDFYLEQQLAGAYATIGSQGQLNQPVMDALGLDWLPQYYIRSVPGTPLMEVVVTDMDPARAQAVANELANQLANSTPALNGEDTAQRQAFINDQLDKLEAEIKDTDQKISDANESLAQANSARQIADTQSLIEALETKRIDLQANYSALIANTESGSINNINILQLAPLPSQPVGPNKLLYLILAAAVGFSGSVMVAYLIDLIDNRASGSEEIAHMLGKPVLGQIPVIPKKDRAIYTIKNPRSPITDSFRSLRTNIEFMSINKQVKLLLITGTDLNAGKTTLASNLALAFAQAEKRVILVEADLRHPQLHGVLELPGEPGVSDVCLGRADLENTLIPWESEHSDLAGEDGLGLRDSSMLRFLPAGTLPPNPAELIASPRFDQILADLSKMADIVIIDSPPLPIPDATVLLNKVSGVLLVFDLKQTRKKLVAMAKDQVMRSGATLLGVAINRVGVQQSYYHYGYPKPPKPAKRAINLRLPRLKPGDSEVTK